MRSWEYYSSNELNKNWTLLWTYMSHSLFPFFFIKKRKKKRSQTLPLIPFPLELLPECIVAKLAYRHIFPCRARAGRLAACSRLLFAVLSHFSITFWRRHWMESRVRPCVLCVCCVRGGWRLRDSNLRWCCCGSRGTPGWNWAPNWKGREEVTITSVEQGGASAGGMMGRTFPRDELGKSHPLSKSRGESLRVWTLHLASMIWGRWHFLAVTLRYSHTLKCKNRIWWFSM